MADWQAIKTEYITTDTSYRKLAQKYGVSTTQICNVGRDEKWVEQREQYLNKTTAKAIEKISQQEANRAAKIQTVADKLLNKIDSLVDRPGMMPKDVRYLVAAVKDLNDIQGVKSKLDEQEQRARIANLQKQADKEDGNTEPIRVIIGDDLSEYSK